VDNQKPDEIKKENPESTETKQVKEIVMNDKSDAFTADERKEIVSMVRADVDYMEDVQKDYIAQKKLDLQHYHMESPSELEGLEKSNWQSDRNLGLGRAVADSYIATLLATGWNPDSINIVATKTLDIDNRTNQEKFIKWGMGKHEANAAPEVRDFVHNRVVVGSSFFKIYRKTWDEWVDKRIPVKNKKGETTRYEIKTEKVKLQRGVIENIPDIDDILMPEYGKNIQELPCFAQILHLYGENVLGLIDRGVLRPKDKEQYKLKLRNNAFDAKERVLGEEKLKSLGVSQSSMTDVDVRRMPIDLYEWYGMYTKDGRTERFRMIVDLTNDELLSGKPVRKINRSGKIPFVGGALAKEPGMLRGVSLMQIIAPIVNAFNNVFNQKSDFQYVTNCPFGFHNPEEGYTNQTYELQPMTSYPVAGKPNESVYFPNIQRSMAWAESDIRILLEILERLTGAATYFQTNGKGVSGTATRDMLIDKNSETRFGLWVFGLQQDICEAVSMWFELYQDYPPKNLAERVVGADGKQLFRNLSIDSLRGDTDVQMTPDTVAGSKQYRKQLQLWAIESSAQCVWLNPQMNPRGNWQLWADTYKEILNMSDSEVTRYLGEQPKAKFDEAELNNEWYRFMNGEDFDPPEGQTALAIQHMEGHLKQKEEKYHLLDKEYRPVFDAHLFKTMVNALKFMKDMQTNAMADRMAAGAIIRGQEMGVTPPGQAMPGQPGMGQPAQPGLPAPGAIAAPGSAPVQGQPMGGMGA
jgi:hypothetical protein